MPDVVFCLCGNIALKDGKCPKHLKQPMKVKNEKREQFRGRSKFAETEGLFKGSYE